MKANSVFLLPDANDPTGIDQHRSAVLHHFHSFFELADSAIRHSVPKAKDLFALFSGPIDKAVHAMNTRYIVKTFLAGNGLDAEEERDSEPVFNIERVSNCGLFIRLSNAEIRILKSCPDGIPKATSEPRREFYSSNQMNLKFVEEQPTPSDSILRLVLLWDVDSDLNFTGLVVACPRGQLTDGPVDSYWTANWNSASAVATPAISTEHTDADLEEITAVDDRSIATAKK